MIRRALNIGRWLVEFYFAGEDGYDTNELIDRLYDFGADIHSLRKAWSLMESDLPNTGFTFSNQQDRLAIVAIGPTSSGAEFQDTFVHEVHHLAVAIADSLGLDLDGEDPAYIAGDTARDLAEILCTLGCEHCRHR